MQRDNHGEFINFLELWKDRYEHFVMDRCVLIDEEEKKHLFAYIYPKSSLAEDNEIKDYTKNDNFKFERIKLKVEEVREIIQNLEADLENREIKITYPEGLVYTLKSEQHPFEEILKVKDRYGNIGMYMPCYRLQVKAEGFIDEDKELYTASNIGYPDVTTAAKSIFKHKDTMFKRDTYTTGVCYPLIVDLSHFEWYIKRFEYFRNIAEIEIQNMVKKEIEKPFGVLNVEFTNGKEEMREVIFESNSVKEVFKHNIANIKFHLQTNLDTGFSGDFNNPKPGGRILDYRQSIGYSVKSEDFIVLDDLSTSEIIRLIDGKENETVEFKSVIKEKLIENQFRKIGMQMTGMANAKSKGLVIVGVNKIGQIEGVGELKIEDFMNNLQQSLDSNCDPWIDFVIKEFELLAHNENKKLLIVSLLADKERCPYLYRKGRTTYGIPLRRGEYTKWLTPKEIREYMFELHKKRSSKKGA